MRSTLTIVPERGLSSVRSDATAGSIPTGRWRGSPVNLAESTSPVSESRLSLRGAPSCLLRASPEEELLSARTEGRACGATGGDEADFADSSSEIMGDEAPAVSRSGPWDDGDRWGREAGASRSGRAVPAEPPLRARMSGEPFSVGAGGFAVMGRPPSPLAPERTTTSSRGLSDSAGTCACVSGEGFEPLSAKEADPGDGV